MAQGGRPSIRRDRMQLNSQAFIKQEIRRTKGMSRMPEQSGVLVMESRILKRRPWRRFGPVSRFILFRWVHHQPSERSRTRSLCQQNGWWMIVHNQASFGDSLASVGQRSQVSMKTTQISSENQLLNIIWPQGRPSWATRVCGEPTITL